MKVLGDESDELNHRPSDRRHGVLDLPHQHTYTLFKYQGMAQSTSSGCALLERDEGRGVALLLEGDEGLDEGRGVGGAPARRRIPALDGLEARAARDASARVAAAATQGVWVEEAVESNTTHGSTLTC